MIFIFELKKCIFVNRIADELREARGCGDRDEYGAGGAEEGTGRGARRRGLGQTSTHARTNTLQTHEEEGAGGQT